MLGEKKNGQGFAVRQGMGPRAGGGLTCEALVLGESCSSLADDLCPHQQRALVWLAWLQGET